MPAPRIFISSTCYDLQEIRGNLRNYVEDFGYEPIMSDFGDIFYNFEKHVQDACIEEIKNADMYILIIGDYYGSTYHRDKNTKEVPSSVTLKEFKNAVSLDIPKMIFINKFVEYDYRNYRRYLEEKLKELFSKEGSEKLDTEQEIKKTKELVDQVYPFPKKSYKYVFHFLDNIDELQKGNGYHLFETSQEIKFRLKKQWAGFLYESLKSRKDHTGKIIEGYSKLNEKVDKIHKNIESILDNSHVEDNNISINLDQVYSSFPYEKFIEMQEIFEEVVNDFLYVESNDLLGLGFNTKRFVITKKFDEDTIEKWLIYLDETLKKYKWSKFINLEIILGDFFEYEIKIEGDLIYDTIFRLTEIYIKLDNEEKNSYISSIKLKLEKIYIIA